MPTRHMVNRWIGPGTNVGMKQEAIRSIFSSILSIIGEFSTTLYYLIIIFLRRSTTTVTLVVKQKNYIIVSPFEINALNIGSKRRSNLKPKKHTRSFDEEDIVGGTGEFDYTSKVLG